MSSNVNVQLLQRHDDKLVVVEQRRISINRICFGKNDMLIKLKMISDELN